jgi:hypothetical protein
LKKAKGNKISDNESESTLRQHIPASVPVEAQQDQFQGSKAK